MLRALGIAFIACSLMLFGITLGGTAWWLVSSRVITIRGVNDSPATVAKTDENLGQAPAGNMAAVAQPHLPSKQADRPKTLVRSASYQSPAAAVDDRETYLQNLKLLRIEATYSGNTKITFAAPFEATPVFPATPTSLSFIFNSNLTTHPELSTLLTLNNVPTSDATLTNNLATFKFNTNQSGVLKLAPKDLTPNTTSINTSVAICTTATATLKYATSPYANALASVQNLYDDYLRFDFPEGTDIPSIAIYAAQETAGITQQLTPSTSAPYNDGVKLTTPSLEIRGPDSFGRWTNEPKVTLYVVRRTSQGYESFPLMPLIREASTGRNDLLIAQLKIEPKDSTTKLALFNDKFYVNRSQVKITGNSNPTPGSILVLQTEKEVLKVAQSSSPLPSELVYEGTLPDGQKTLHLNAYQGSRIIAAAKPIQVEVLTKGPEVQSIVASGFAVQDTGVILVKFDPSNPLKIEDARTSSFYSLTPDQQNTKINALSADYDTSSGVVTLRFDRDLSPGIYTFEISNLLKNVVDITYGGTEKTKVTKISSSSSPDTTRGLTGLPGESPEYKEFTDPRETTAGFNPSDKVISRMARLYYFRDAHRVVQLINRKAQSFNRAAVDAQEQVADAARKNADQSTVDRREAENSAIRAAKEARAAETALEEHQQALITSRKTLATLTDDLAQVDGVIRELQQQGAAIQSEFTLEDLSNLEKLESKQNAALTDTERLRLQALESKQVSSTPLTDSEKLEIAGLRSKRDKFPDLTPAESTQLRNLQKKRTDGLRRDQLIASAPAVQLSDLDLADPAVPVRRLSQTRDALRQQIRDTESNIRQEETIVRQLSSTVQSERDQEIKATAKWESLEQQERLKRDEQFRREVAAGHADPDTYVAGKPDSDDPVAQVSLAVAGEGLIQMRGPRKGVNEVHRMINEIDSPVGQVKVAIHTVQVNGEHGDRMQEVAFRIQSYIDHSRFLTMQSSQLLRNAVVSVASRRAEAVASQCPPGASQQLMMQKYQEAFFGADFIHELRELDSEFLQNGNKLLSLHSMDTTSLSNALFLMALAKNDVRQEILGEFTMGLQTRLPQYELQFYQGSAPKPAWRDRTLAEKIKPGAIREKHLAPFEMMAQNAQFASLRGFFDVAVSSPDTMTPMQREFVKLAQIFKARLVTEVELRQRIMERALIEERVGDYQTTLADAVEREKAALQRKDSARAAVLEAAESVKGYAAPIRIAIQNIRSQSTRNIQDLNSVLANLQKASADKYALGAGAVNSKGYNDAYAKFMDGQAEVRSDFIISRDALQTFEARTSEVLQLPSDPIGFEAEENPSDVAASKKDLLETFRNYREVLINHIKTIEQFALLNKHQAKFDSAKRSLSNVDTELKKEADISNTSLIFKELNAAAVNLSEVYKHILDTVTPVETRFLLVEQLFSTVVVDPDRVDELVQEWGSFRSDSLKWLRTDAPAMADSTEKQNLHDQAVAMVKKIDGLLGIGSGISGSTLLEQVAKYRIAVAAAENARRPLDHKKYLDMLIDDAEETCIDLIEGTRAQTSNIDNYLQRLGLALEDDFNKQFYQPAFRRAQEASYFYDVSVGQIETTSIVANNRAFAKVSPQATMEFDLPKRDILINEAANSALAAYNDYGALLGDPNFVALLKLYGGQSPANSFGGLGSPQVIRPLPGLPSGTDSQFMTSSTGSSPKIGSSLEALIPDPAVYKFETGTGYEIRPVIQPDGQAVVFHFDYLFGTNIREPVRADEKHLGRVRQHYIDTDVVSGNYELREVSTYRVALKAARSSRGVPFLEDIPAVGVLFRPAVNAESSLQENIILSQTVIYPTLFDLMGLRWAPAVSDLDSLALQERKFVTSEREHVLRNEVFDDTSKKVDEFLRIETERRRPDLYRSQRIIPTEHPLQYEAYPGTMLHETQMPDAANQQNPAPAAQDQPTEPVPQPPGHGDIQPNGLPPVHPSSWSGANRGQGGQTQRPHNTGSRNSGHASLDATTPAKAGPLPRRTSPARTPQKQGNGWSIPGIRR